MVAGWSWSCVCGVWLDVVFFSFFFSSFSLETEKGGGVRGTRTGRHEYRRQATSLFCMPGGASASGREELFNFSLFLVTLAAKVFCSRRGPEGKSIFQVGR